MSKKNATIQEPQTTSEEPTTEEEEMYPLVYNFYNYGGIHITVEAGGTVVFQAGKPKDPPPPGPGG